ncbi:MAG: nucleotidyl transferase AbiEii/AbiGii toxin family protein, partial [bacterium]
MTKREIKDVAASVRQRLQNRSRETGRPFNEALQYYAMERFLYRLSRSAYSEKFVLKGALMLTVWKSPISRPTMDIDLLGRLENDLDKIVGVIKDVCVQDVESDGLVFEPNSMKAERITEAAEYEGVRVRFRGHLGNVRVVMQLDIGFGDIVVPSIARVEYPTMLDMPAPRLLGYSRESTVAEKFEAMAKLGARNSRMKDFFDIWLLSRQFDFDGNALAEAVKKTFASRGTTVPSHPFAFVDEMKADPTKETQWRGFIRKSRIENAPLEFGVVVDA